MQCARHPLEAGPDGRCVLCRRTEGATRAAVTRQSDRDIRRITKLIVAVIAGVAAFALMLALFDTR